MNTRLHTLTLYKIFFLRVVFSAPSGEPDLASRPSGGEPYVASHFLYLFNVIILLAKTIFNAA